MIACFVTGREFDSEEKVSTGVIDLGSSDLELVYEGPGTVGNEQVVLIVFPDVQIPPGSPVMSASRRCGRPSNPTQNRAARGAAEHGERRTSVW